MSSISAYDLLDERVLSEFRSSGIWLRHKKTGCQVLHLLNDDPENLFSFIFKTIPENSTGLPHILEHAVLSGSENFPLKDPFAALLKGSMQTFLNAMTFPDKTMYPASSTVKKDYFNLLTVYGDAVFFPLLKREVFDQEGYRVVVRDDDTLSLTGIVYNEMKGNYGNHDTIAGELSYRSLFATSPYRYDSGGDPHTIPDLSYEEFLKFHRTNYHPSNCRIFLYGNIPTGETADFIDTHFLSRFDQAADIGYSLKDQSLEEPKWKEPRVLKATSPLAAGQSEGGGATIMMNWLLSPVTDTISRLSMEVLAEILLGNSGSPLRKAIVDSSLGEDLSPISGLESDLLNLAFSAGIRGSQPDKIQDFENLVFSTLEGLAADGIHRDAVTGALHKVEFRNREIPSGGPFGLRLLGKAIKGWLHDVPPLQAITFSSAMEKVKTEAGRDDAYFSRIIREQLLENTHRTTVLIQPDADHAAREEEKLTRRLKELESSISGKERDAFRKSNQALADFQQREEHKEALEALPRLELSDLPRDVEPIPLERENIGSTVVYSHDTFTNGIAYIDFIFDISDLAPEDEVYLPLLSRAVTNTGLEGQPYDIVARELAMIAGGFNAFSEVGALPLSPGNGKGLLIFRLKALREKIPAALNLAHQLMQHADLGDEKRIQDLLLEMRNDLKSRIIPRGSTFAMLRAAAQLSPIGVKEERLRGISQLIHLQELAQSEQELRLLPEKLTALRNQLVVRSRLQVVITGDAPIKDDAARTLSSLLNNLPEGPQPGAMVLDSASAPPIGSGEIGEFISLPGTVGFAASAYPGARIGEALHPPQSVLAHILSTGYLWEKIRMQGGAYGASAGTNGTEGIFTFSSYRDPRFPTTPRIFREALEETASKAIDTKALETAIIGTVGRDAHPIAPGVRGLIALRRLMYGVTDELRQQKRDKLLSMKPKELSQAAQAVLDGFDSGVTVIAGPESIADAGDPSLEDTVKTEISL